MIPVVPQSVATIPDAELIALFAAATALAGLFVASLAYWGYCRNESRPMLYLAVGIVLLTTVPVGVNYALPGVAGATDAETLLVVTVSHLVGVFAILYALTDA